MRSPLQVLAVLATCGVSALAAAQDDVPISPRLGALVRAVDAGDVEAEQSFWHEIAAEHAPLIETIPGSPHEMFVTFLWQAPPGRTSANVGVYGEFGNTGNAWPVNERLQRLGDTSVWYATHRMSTEACFGYHLSWPQGEVPAGEPVLTAVDGQAIDRFVDALNPRMFSNARSLSDAPVLFSFASGPAADPPVTARSNIAVGKVQTLQFDSQVLQDTRDISIYTPPGAERGCAKCDLLLVFDQTPYLLAVQVPAILDNLQADGLLRPVLAVFVGNGPFPARFRQLTPNEKFQEFLRGELMPWLRARYDFSRDPRRAVIAGASLGGLAAAFAALKNPDLFGNVLSQSGSHWWWPDYDPRSGSESLHAASGWLGSQFAATRKLPLRFYVEVGTWEGALMLLPNRQFRDVLLARGYDVEYREFVGGHDYACWRASFPRGLLSLLGKRVR